ncbi:GAP family protein [Brevibacterium casei]
MLESDLLRFAGAAVSLIGLGIVMGISPTTIAVSLRVLTDVPRAKRAMGFMLLGLVLGATVIMLALQVIDPRTLEALVSRDVEKVLVRHSVDLAAGAIFIIAGIIMALRLRRPPKPKKPHKKPTGSPWTMTLIGLSNTVISFSDFATMYIVARILRAVSEDIVIRGVSYLVFIAAMIAPYVLLTWAWNRFPRVAERISSFFSRLAEANLRPWATAFVLLAGLVFLAMGIWGEPRL